MEVRKQLSQIKYSLGVSETVVLTNSGTKEVHEAPEQGESAALRPMRLLREHKMLLYLYKITGKNRTRDKSWKPKRTNWYHVITIGQARES